MYYKRKEIKKMTLIESVLIIGSVVGALISTLCYNIRRSRCTTVNMGCVSCSRELMTEKELKNDVLNNQMMTRSYSETTNNTPKFNRSDSDYNKSNMNLTAT
jgi:hypothetical protein